MVSASDHGEEEASPGSAGALPFGAGSERDELSSLGGFAPGFPDLALLKEAQAEGLKERLVSGTKSG
jgi:hypothetical protein